MARRARWSLETMSAARRRAKGRRSSWATTWFTSPHCRAVVASMKFPVALISAGPADADGLGQEHRQPPQGVDADAGVGVGETGPLRRHQEVAVERQLEPAGHGRRR